MRPLVICGDSFNIGIGCRDLSTEPYGSLLATHYGLPLINLAKGSSSNFSVYLQARYAAAMPVKPRLVIISLTSYDRGEWFPEDFEGHDLDVRDVNYHQYPPYGEGSYLPDQRPPHPFEGDPRYRGRMFTDQYSALWDYTDNCRGKGGNYYARFDREPLERIELVKSYFLDVFDHNIKRDYDLGMFAFAHLMMRSRGIPHVIMSHDDRLNEFLPAENLLRHSWFDLATKYPDDLPSAHTSPFGHRLTFGRLVDHLDRHKLLGDDNEVDS